MKSQSSVHGSRDGGDVPQTREQQLRHRFVSSSERGLQRLHPSRDECTNQFFSRWPKSTEEVVLEIKFANHCARPWANLRQGTFPAVNIPEGQSNCHKLPYTRNTLNIAQDIMANGCRICAYLHINYFHPYPGKIPCSSPVEITSLDSLALC